ncbi:Hypothetical predicted protein [Cloeon dipterum]|uniref:Uncharacterized protein n=1 Tax=Cloeon dipterum TaxID=197152 RepID=A0A8S1D639_9INSE|nr:Hypothetical predicted protein [Cloeon dipterum]
MRQANLFLLAAVLVFQICFALENTNKTAAIKSSPLSKFVAALSKPGAFAKEAKNLLGEEMMKDSSKCPTGEDGLECRRQEARSGADSCHHTGGDCTECQNCGGKGPTEWLSCCETHFRCCADVALACQRCDQPQLLPFCMKRFKKCFHAA